MQVPVCVRLFTVDSLLLASLVTLVSRKGTSSKHFAETMRDVSVGSDESLVSFDVTPLFTIVSIGEAVGIIRDKLREQTSKLLLQKKLTNSSLIGASSDIHASSCNILIHTLILIASVRLASNNIVRARIRGYVRVCMIALTWVL